MLFKLCILSYLASKRDPLLCFTSLFNQISLFHFVLSITLLAFFSCHKTEVLCYQLTSFPYLSPEMQAKTNRFITALMTAGCMLSEFLNSTKLLFLPKHVELQQSTFYWDCYLQMKNDSAGKNYLVSAVYLFLASCLVKLQKISLAIC